MKVIIQGIKVVFILLIILVLGSSTGVSFLKSNNTNFSLTVDLEAMALMVEEEIANDIYAAKDTYTGSLTGYGADCPLCNGTLACMRSLDVLHGNVTYEDSVYGTVNIVASSKKIPCGSIIRINEHKLSNEPLYAIVLDRGVGKYNLDLLTVSEEYAKQYVGRSTVTYDILRKGW